jgi:hypothetical protein
MASGECHNFRHHEATYRGLDMLPQSPQLQPRVVRTPTPPWGPTDMEVAEPEDNVVGVVTERSAPSGEGRSAPRKAKRVRVRLDTRIELTDEELKVLHCFSHIHWFP